MTGLSRKNKALPLKSIFSRNSKWSVPAASTVNASYQPDCFDVTFIKVVCFGSFVLTVYLNRKMAFKWRVKENLFF
jgi:hypothetical protein